MTLDSQDIEKLIDMLHEAHFSLESPRRLAVQILLSLSLLSHLPRLNESYRHRLLGIAQIAAIRLEELLKLLVREGQIVQRGGDCHD